MYLYNEDLVAIGKVNENYNSLFNDQMQFILNTVDNKEKITDIIQERLDNTILLECDMAKGKEYRSTLYDGKRLKLSFGSAGAFVAPAMQTRNENGWDIVNGIHIRKGAYGGNNYKDTLPHEFFHAMSENVKLTFDKDGVCYTKSGFKIIKYDKNDNELNSELKATFLTEGTTEMLANMFNDTLKPHAYSFATFIARVLNGSKTKPTLIDAYFSDNINDVQQFFQNFDKLQNRIEAKDLINLPISENYWKDNACPKIIKGCLEYSINSINSIDDLKSFYKEIKDVTINIADSIAVNIGEEHKDKVVGFIKRSLLELLDKRKKEIEEMQISF